MTLVNAIQNLLKKGRAKIPQISWEKRPLFQESWFQETEELGQIINEAAKERGEK